MRIRPGRTEDAENLTALAIQVWLHTYATEGVSSTISSYVLAEFTPQRFAALAIEPSSALFVAERDDNLLGYALVKGSAACPARSTCQTELATLYVQEPFLGRGVGAPLLKRAELWAIEQTGANLWLKTNAKNSRAIAFYEKHGYSRIGITFFELGGEKYENLVLLGPDAGIDVT